MAVIEHVTLSELQDLSRTLQLPSDTRVTVTFEDSQATANLLKRQRAIVAMNKLRGSGNGKLVTVLLRERARTVLA